MSAGAQVGAPYADTYAELSPTLCGARVRARVDEADEVRVDAKSPAAYDRRRPSQGRQGEARGARAADDVPAGDRRARTVLPRRRAHAVAESASYWSDYFSYGLAMLTLAHE